MVYKLKLNKKKIKKNCICKKVTRLGAFCAINYLAHNITSIVRYSYDNKLQE